MLARLYNGQIRLSLQWSFPLNCKVKVERTTITRFEMIIYINVDSPGILTSVTQKSIFRFNNNYVVVKAKWITNRIAFVYVYNCYKPKESNEI